MKNEKINFITLGPKGSCHENAIINYCRYHGIPDYSINFIYDFDNGLESIRENKGDYLVQCSAHPLVHKITEKYYKEISIVDTYMYPTKHLVLLERRSVEHPKTLGLVKATEGYLDESTKYEEIIYEASKPIIGENLLLKKYDAGLTHIEYYEQNPSLFKMRKDIGSVLTTWIIYGKNSPFNGEIMSVSDKGFLIKNKKQ